MAQFILFYVGTEDEKRARRRKTISRV